MSPLGSIWSGSLRRRHYGTNHFNQETGCIAAPLEQSDVLRAKSQRPPFTSLAISQAMVVEALTELNCQIRAPTTLPQVLPPSAVFHFSLVMGHL
jgi:hypothetical protein